MRRGFMLASRAQMAELVDAPASGAGARKGVEVRVLFWAPVTLGNQPRDLEKSPEICQKKLHCCSMEFHHVSPCFRHFGGMVGGMEPLFGPFPRIPCPQLNTAQIRAFRGGDTPYKKADEKGLYLEVFPNESKLWRFKYRILGKEKRIALGAWPETGLAQARHMRDELRIRLANGEDPALTRKRQKAVAQVNASNTFESVALEYIETKMVGEERAAATLKKAWTCNGFVPVTYLITPPWLRKRVG
jgi:hypothetical protein